MIKQQIFALFYCLGAGFCGLVLGLAFGFYDFAGNVYYDLRGGLVMGGVLFVAFFAACLVQCVNDFLHNQQ